MKGSSDAERRERDARRKAELRRRLRESGLRPFELWARKSEWVRIKQILARWRGERPTGLLRAEVEAADLLKPKEETED